MNNISLSQEVRRGVLRFKYVPGLGIVPRITLFILLCTAGASIMFRVHWSAGAPVFISGLLIIAAHSVSNTRKSPNTKKDRWVVGSAADLRKIERKTAQAGGLPANVLDGSTGWGGLTLITLGALILIADYYVIPERFFNDQMYSIFFMEASALLVIFFSTTASTWEPQTIINKKDLLMEKRDMILSKWKELKPVVRPMLLLDEGDPELVTPEDIKLFVTFEEAPEDFIGVQAQITYNMSQPYLYCVVLAKDSFAPMKRYQPKPAARITFEKGSDGKIQYFVIRQTTTRNSGYATSSKEADHVVNTAMLIALDLLTA